ncbi:unnamed protein product [Rhizoctonia solani]|uniref:Major facilitator superfamily (MFS) profile domain-containing protein n=1 Tax=Rhizoctonia solani TaxID=456999 RepID=A0A8H3BXQ6_9AGAM|nr:unnamed protein product [Rhizoctonia solani]
MSSSTTQALEVPVNEYIPEKPSADGVNPQLPAPPHVVVRARGTTEGIEMNFLGRSRDATEPTFPDDDGSSTISGSEGSRKEWAAVAACGLCLFLSGWQDGSLGPLIPTIQKYYNLTFTVVSLLFVSGCLGFLLAAVLNIYLSDRLSFGGLIFLAGVFQAISYAILIPAFPFPVMALAFVIKGFGVGLQDALANGLVSALRNDPSTKMGIIHSFYGAGALISPTIATQFAYHPHWSYQYMIPLGIASLNLVLLFSIFGFHTQEELLGPIQPTDPAEGGSKERRYKQVFGSWAVQIMAAFALLYVGVETTLGGWIVTFIVEERGAGTSAGYISSGFYGGLMLGRIGLIWVGERRVIYAYILLAIGLEMTVWMLPNMLENAVAFALIGVLIGWGNLLTWLLLHNTIGPMYPIGMNVLGTVVPKWLLIGSMGWVASVGQAGGALFPFLTGTLIQKYGVHVLQPISFRGVEYAIATCGTKTVISCPEQSNNVAVVEWKGGWVETEGLRIHLSEWVDDFKWGSSSKHVFKKWGSNPSIKWEAKKGQWKATDMRSQILATFVVRRGALGSRIEFTDAGKPYADALVLTGILSIAGKEEWRWYTYVQARRDAIEASSRDPTRPVSEVTGGENTIQPSVENLPTYREAPFTRPLGPLFNTSSPLPDQGCALSAPADRPLKLRLASRHPLNGTWYEGDKPLLCVQTAGPRTKVSQFIHISQDVEPSMKVTGTINWAEGKVMVLGTDIELDRVLGGKKGCSFFTKANQKYRVCTLPTLTSYWTTTSHTSSDSIYPDLNAHICYECCTAPPAKHPLALLTHYLKRKGTVMELTPEGHNALAQVLIGALILIYSTADKWKKVAGVGTHMGKEAKELVLGEEMVSDLDGWAGPLELMRLRHQEGNVSSP